MFDDKQPPAPAGKPGGHGPLPTPNVPNAGSAGAPPPQKSTPPAPGRAGPEDIFAETEHEGPMPGRPPAPATHTTADPKAEHVQPAQAEPLTITHDKDAPSPFVPVGAGDKGAPPPPPGGAPKPGEAPGAPPAPGGPETPAHPKMPELSADHGGVNAKKIVLIVVGVLVVGGLGYAGWYIYRENFASEQPAEDQVEQEAAMEGSPSDVDSGTPSGGLPSGEDAGGNGSRDDVDTSSGDSDQPFGVAPGQFPDLPPDKDADGLSDAEEELHGTNPLSSDTDGDSLYDREEVKVWKTDPTNVDTDGDGFQDGEEISQGFNPLGSGRLQRLPGQP